jgi:hypothetical protein
VLAEVDPRLPPDSDEEGVPLRELGSAARRLVPSGLVPMLGFLFPDIVLLFVSRISIRRNWVRAGKRDVA